MKPYASLYSEKESSIDLSEPIFEAVDELLNLHVWIVIIWLGLKRGLCDTLITLDFKTDFEYDFSVSLRPRVSITID